MFCNMKMLGSTTSSCTTFPAICLGGTLVSRGTAANENIWLKKNLVPDFMFIALSKLLMKEFTLPLFLFTCLKHMVK